MARFRGTSRNDSYRGTRSADEIDGAGGDDWLHGGSGDDRIIGGSGRDALAGGLGNDLLDGGEGIDAVFYEDASAGVTVNLRTGRASDGDGGTDRLRSIEVVFGSRFADGLTGGDGDDELHGGRGDDRLSGGGGDDLLFGDEGSDRIDGGSGADFVSYFALGASVDLDLSVGRAADSSGGVDALTGIEGAYGSQLNDRLAGDGGNNLLVGNGGNDELLGRAGNDTLDGGDGNDVIDGGSGTDVMWGGGGNDLFVFAPGSIAASRQSADVIVDFGNAADIIDLSALDANANTSANDRFTFIGTAAFSGRAGQLRIEVSDGDTWIMGDVDGDRVADGYILLDGQHALSEADFFL